jgi:hypothetical protein
MAKVPEIMAVATDLYNILKPLDPETRGRAIRATLTLLGDETTKLGGGSDAGGGGGEDSADGTLSPKVRAWMRTNDVSQEQLDAVFHIEGDTVDLLASEVPGKDGKLKTVNAYVLTGLGQLVKTGDAKFTDKEGRAACTKYACYQPNNHSTIMKEAKTVLTGDKTRGWTVTGPGLKAAAALVKEIAGA